MTRDGMEKGSVLGEDLWLMREKRKYIWILISYLCLGEDPGWDQICIINRPIKVRYDSYLNLMTQSQISSSMFTFPNSLRYNHAYHASTTISSSCT